MRISLDPQKIKFIRLIEKICFYFQKKQKKVYNHSKIGKKWFLWFSVVFPHYDSNNNSFLG
jgi:hypothetical protein